MLKKNKRDAFMENSSLTSLVAQPVDDFIKQLSTLEQADEKIEKMLEYMQLQLSHGEIHPLSRFWTMRTFCLEHFKGTIAVSKRLILWKNYCQVVDEIVKLKQLMDEKSAFEKEQIEDALTSIEADLKKVDILVKNEPEITIPKCGCLQKNKAEYISSQKKLNVYSAYAKRLNSLKKEILSLDISFKKKQEILDQVHQLGDQVFPPKREILNVISEIYTQDIQFFVKVNFSSLENVGSLFHLKEQIKLLQTFAKIISLNVQSFSQTRQVLSECWDKIKVYEKEQKKQKDAQRKVCDENHQGLLEKITALKDQKEQLKKESFNGQLAKLSSEIKQQDLLRFQKNQLEEQLIELDDDKKFSSAEEEYIDGIKSEISHIKEHLSQWDYITIDSQIKSLLSHYDSSKIHESSQADIDQSLFELKETQAQKLFEEINERIDLEELSLEIEGFRKTLKQALDKYKTVLKSSNQSIEKAIVYNELLVRLKAVLVDLDQHINNHQGSAS